jgi:hypothetical protein
MLGPINEKALSWEGPRPLRGAKQSWNNEADGILVTPVWWPFR